MRYYLQLKVFLKIHTFLVSLWDILIWEYWGSSSMVQHLHTQSPGFDAQHCVCAHTHTHNVHIYIQFSSLQEWKQVYVKYLLDVKKKYHEWVIHAHIVLRSHIMHWKYCFSSNLCSPIAFLNHFSDPHQKAQEPTINISVPT